MQEGNSVWLCILCSSEGQIQEGNTEWVKMLNRDDLYRPTQSARLVTNQIQKPEPGPAPVPNVAHVSQKSVTFEDAPRLQPNEKPTYVKEKGAKLPVMVPPKIEVSL